MKVLPNSKEAEMCLLGCMLIDDSIVSQVDLEDKDFHYSENFIIYRAIKALKEHKGKCDILLVKELLESNDKLELIGGILYLSELTEIVPTTSNYPEYLGIIKEKSNRRRMIVLARDIEKAGFSEGEDINKYLGKIENIGADLFIQKNQGDTYEDLVDKYENLRERYHKLGGLGEPSAYKKLDEYHKGVIPGTVQTIVAYSNVGKSSFAYSLIVDLLKRGKKVTIFSNEVTSDMLFSLLIKYYYNSSFDSVMRPEYVFEPSDFRNLVIYDNVINLQEIDMLTKHSDADSVFIDFIQNVECEGKGEYEVMTKVAKGIQRLAIATNKTIFSISQANNESRFASGDKIQPKGSGAIFASSDVILALSTTARNDTLNLNILKNKFGKKDINFALDVDFDKGKFQISRQIDELEDQPKA